MQGRVEGRGPRLPSNSMELVHREGTNWKYGRTAS